MSAPIVAVDGNDDRDFESSELGTKDYWDKVYDRELETFEDIGDVGEIWFGEDSQNRVARWLEKSAISPETSVLDLGCGNGAMLIELRNNGFTNLTGIDYSSGAIQLAKKVAEADGFKDIVFEVGDLTAEDSIGNCPCFSRKYGVCLDKGTYDAISLMPTSCTEARVSYLRIVKTVMVDDGIFILTSCNWTKEQLLEFFGKDFRLEANIPTPSFQFGGKQGNTVTTLVLKKS
ncbi:hypothetical protein ScPMuIL_008734 [Solemya velum]